MPKSLKKHAFKVYRYLPSRNKTVTTTIDGITYELDLSKRIPASIFYYGCFEEDTTRIIESFVKRGMVVFDIGANMGCHALRCAKIVGAEGRVYAFEPMSPVYNQLLRGIHLNDFTNIIPEKIALSNKNEEKKMRFHIYSSLVGKKELPDEESMNFMKLDDYVKNNNIKKIDFMKIDVDGYECKIIEGGFSTLKKFKPMIIIEMGKEIQKRYGGSIDRLVGWLKILNYSFFDEKTLQPYSDSDDLLAHIPEKKTINVFCR